MVMHQIGLSHNSYHLMHHYIISDKRICKFKVGLNASGACLGLELLRDPQTLLQIIQNNQTNQKNQDSTEMLQGQASHWQSNYRDLHEDKMHASK